MFDTLEGVKNKTIDADRSRAICEVSKQIIDTPKVAGARGWGARGSGFIPAARPPQLPSSGQHSGNEQRATPAQIGRNLHRPNGSSGRR